MVQRSELEETIRVIQPMVKELTRINNRLILSRGNPADLCVYENLNPREQLGVINSKLTHYLDQLRTLSSSRAGNRWRMRNLASRCTNWIPIRNSLGFRSIAKLRDWKWCGTRNRQESIKRVRRIGRAVNPWKCFATFTSPEVDVNFSKLMREYFDNLRWSLPKLLAKLKEAGPEYSYNYIIDRLNAVWDQYEMKKKYEEVMDLSAFFGKVWPWINNYEKYCPIWKTDSKGRVVRRLAIEYLWTIEVQNLPHAHCLLNIDIPFSILALYWPYPVVNITKVEDGRMAANYLSSYFSKNDDELSSAVRHNLIRTFASRSYFASRGVRRVKSQWVVDSELDYEMTYQSETKVSLAELQEFNLESNMLRWRELFEEKQSTLDWLAIDVNRKAVCELNRLGLVDSDWLNLYEESKMNYDDWVDKFELRGLAWQFFGQFLKENWDKRYRVDWNYMFRNCNSAGLDSFLWDDSIKRGKVKNRKQFHEELNALWESVDHDKIMVFSPVDSRLNESFLELLSINGMQMLKGSDGNEYALATIYYKVKQREWDNVVIDLSEGRFRYDEAMPKWYGKDE